MVSSEENSEDLETQDNRLTERSGLIELQEDHQNDSDDDQHGGKRGKNKKKLIFEDSYKSSNSVERFTMEELEVEIRRSVVSIIENYITPVLSGVTWVVLIIAAQLLWSHSDSTCSDDLILCLYDKGSDYLNSVFCMVCYSAIHCYILAQCALTNNSKLRTLGLTIALVSIFCRWIQSPGIYSVDFGAASYTVAYFSGLALGLITLFVLGTFWLYRRLRFGRMPYFYLWCSFWGLVGLIWWTGRFSYTCIHLQDSLDPKVFIMDLPGICKWTKPDNCPQYTYKGLYSPLYWGRATCDKYETDLNQYHQV